MFANFPMNSALGGVSMDCVVVGHVSLNKKRAKKNLQKIAHGPAATKRASVTPQASTTPAVVSAEPKIPKQTIAKPQPILAKPLPLIQEPALSTVFTSLPEGVLGQILGDLGSIGAMAAAGRDLKQQVWEDASFWQLKLGSAAAAPREAFRTKTFKLDGEWLMDFAEFTHTAAPLAMLERALEITQGLMPVDKQAGRFMELLCNAVRKCDATDASFDLLDTIGLKVAQKEGTVFAAHCLDDLSAAREDLVERGILQRLDEQVDVDVFDPFEEPAQPEPQAWIVDGPLPELLLTPAKPAEPALDERSTDDESDDEEYYSVCDDEDVALGKHVAGLQDDFLDLLR